MKEKIILKHKKILKELKKHNKKYFIDDNPEISDAEFDQIKTKSF